MKAETIPSDGYTYFAYALLYVDDIFLVHHYAMTALISIDKYFKMKEVSMGDPDFYLGAKLRKITLANGVEAWAMSSSKYVNAAVTNFVSHLKSRGQEHMMPKRAATPFKGGNQPELDVSEELNAEDVTYFQSQIAILRWAQKYRFWHPT